MVVTFQDICQLATKKERIAKANEIRASRTSNTIVMFKTGDYCEAYEESAEVLVKECGLTKFTQHGITECRFKSKDECWYTSRLVYRGYKICVFENYY